MSRPHPSAGSSTIPGQRTGSASDLDLSPLGLAGVGERRAAGYASAGLLTRRDLLYHLPHRYRSRPAPVTVAELVAGERAAICGRVLNSSVRRRGRKSTVSLAVEDDAGDEVTVLLFNRAYLAKGLGRRTRVWAAGRVEREAGDARPRLLAADYERLPDGDELPAEDSLLPLYRLPKGIPPKVHRKVVAQILAAGAPPDWRIPDPGEPGLEQALSDVHDPRDLADVERGRLRLARDEAFALSFDVAGKRREQTDRRAPALSIDDDLHEALLARLGHTPTAAQARAIDTLRADLSCERPMARLLQGDVGSGKTLVALYALLAAVECGRQAAIMAPTEILALQHVATFRALLGLGEDAVALITGRGTAAERRAARAAVADGTARLAVGTHGLQTQGVEFADLAVAIVDEQHRFGVRQRIRFRTKGIDSHLLVMTATPIPRTLSLTAYGELDVSLIDELPPGRFPRRTVFVSRGRQTGLWRHVGEAVARGERGYVVCPSIAAGDGELDASVATTLELVRERLGPKVSVAAVHGKLPTDERDEVLAAFRTGDITVLVATVIIEVGLDVPEASFVVVPDPTRFGLATLHQIRGRVGRGAVAGTCYLLGPVKKGPAADRVRALVETEDGFLLAEEDLRLRGPGEMLGTRQSGMPGFLVLDPVGDVEVLADTRPLALELARGLDERALARLRRAAFPAVDLRRENLLAGG